MKRLAGLSVTELQAIISEKKQAELQPTVDKLTEAEKKVAELRKEILAIDPNWRPPTLADRIVSYIASCDKAPKLEQIKKHFMDTEGNKFVANAVKKFTGTKWETDKSGGYVIIPKKA